MLRRNLDSNYWHYLYNFISGCQNGIMNHVAEEKGNLAYALRRVLSCNHIRAYEYFIDSINAENCHFVGVECESWDDFVGGLCPG